MPRIPSLPFALILLAPLAGCTTRHVWHQTLRVVVATPDGPREGAATVEVTADFGKVLLSANEVSYDERGEATAVEVAPGRWLFALLPGSKERYACAAGGARDWSGPWNDHPAQAPARDLSRGEWLAVIPTLVGEPPVPVPDECLPLMVTFDDLDDPASVRRVDPHDLAATFGDGVALEAVTIAVTEAAVTEGRVRDLLPWLSSDPEPPLVRSSDPFNPEHYGSSIKHGYFVEGI